jgi:hypothetical protein
MPHARFFVLIAVAAVVLGGCMRTGVTMLTPHHHPAVLPEDVRVFLSRSTMPAGCEALVVIRVRGDVDLTTENQMIAAARRRASRVGANALLIEHIRNPSTETQIAAVLFGTPDPRRGRMVGFVCPPHETADEDAVS